MHKRALISGLLFVACGDGGISLEDLPVKGTSQICEGLVACGEYPDQETCENSVAVFANLDLLNPDIESGSLRYDSDAANDCLDAYDEFTDCELKPSSALEELSDTCAQVFIGSVEVGETCNESVQCVGDALCRREICPDQCCAGSCVAIAPDVVADEGEMCGNGIDCVDGAFCGPSNLCMARPGPGEACTDLAMCAAGSVCNIDLFGNEPGTCVELKGEGESCDSSILFSDLRCLRIDNYCDANDNTCKPRLPVGTDCDQQNCVNFALCIEGTCQARPKAGEACNPQEQLSCLPALECIEGTCALPNGLYCPLETQSTS